MRKVKEAQREYSYETVEKLDELITAGMLCAEQECRHDARLPWSEEIHEKMTQVNTLQLYISSLKNKVDCTDKVEKKQQTLKVKQDLPKNNKRNNRPTQGGPKTGTKNVEGISIQKNDSIRGLGRGIHSKSPQYVSCKSS